VGHRADLRYFQIPLMVLVFLPAIDGLKVQWREASENLGASRGSTGGTSAGRCWRRPSSAATLLLFANALSAFATIQAWENQIAYIVPQQISTALSSEVGLSNVNVADLLALGMVIMVAIVMTGTPCCSAGRHDGCGNRARRDAPAAASAGRRAACRLAGAGG
jgi:putative spermidine/putrescine transport system permease protein